LRPFPLTFAALGVVAAILLRRRIGLGVVAIAVALAALLAIYGFGVVDLPDAEEAIEDVGTTLGAWTYLLVGSLAFLESAAFVGLVAPGEVAVIFGGIIAGRGDINLFVLIVVVWFAAMAGDLAGYAFGRRVGRGWAVKRGHRFGLSEERLQWAENYFASHGGKTIIVGRYIGIVRALTPFIAGTSKMPLRRFMLADFVGAGTWAATFCILGYVFWQSLDRALEYVRAGKFGLGIVFALAVLAFVGYRLVKHPEDRQRSVAWLRERASSLRPKGKQL
jgi:undecaprenyl-diphosphatase